VFAPLQDGSVRFDAPGHVFVHGLDEGSRGYATAVFVCDFINEALSASPGCLLVPLTTAQTMDAQLALNAGLLKIVETWNGDHSRLAWVDIRPPHHGFALDGKYHRFPGREGEPYDLIGLAHAVDAAVERAIIQLELPNSPPGISKSLDLVGDILELHLAQYDNLE